LLKNNYKQKYIAVENQSIEPCNLGFRHLHAAHVVDASETVLAVVTDGDFTSGSGAAQHPGLTRIAVRCRSKLVRSRLRHSGGQGTLSPDDTRSNRKFDH